MSVYKNRLAVMILMISAVIAMAAVAVAVGEQGQASADGEADAYYKYTVSFTVRDVSGYAYYTADYGDGEKFDTRLANSPDVEVVPNDKGTKDITFTHTYPEIEGKRYTFVFTAGNSNGVTVERTLNIVTMGYPTVSFDTGDGTPVAPVEVKNGPDNGGTAENGYYTTVQKPADPVKEGFTFTGWYTDPECTMEYDWNSPVTQDITLYAGWTQPGYRVIFVSDGSVVSEDICKGNIQSPADPVKEGFTFTGWYVDSGCTKRFDNSTITGDTVLYAGFVAVSGDSDTSWILMLAFAVTALFALAAASFMLKGNRKRRRKSRRPVPHR